MLDARHRRWVIALTAIGSVMAAIDTLVVSTAIPTIRGDLHASLTELEWTVNAYNLSLAVLLVPAAVIGDRFGRALLTGAFPPERRGEAVGLYSAVTGIAVACGPLLGGLVLGGLDWQWIFWLNVPLGLLAVPLVLRHVP